MLELWKAATDMNADALIKKLNLKKQRLLYDLSWTVLYYMLENNLQ